VADQLTVLIEGIEELSAKWAAELAAMPNPTEDEWDVPRVTTLRRCKGELDALLASAVAT